MSDYSVPANPGPRQAHRPGPRQEIEPHGQAEPQVRCGRPQGRAEGAPEVPHPELFQPIKIGELRDRQPDRDGPHERADVVGQHRSGERSDPGLLRGPGPRWHRPHHLRVRARHPARLAFPVHDQPAPLQHHAPRRTRGAERDDSRLRLQDLHPALDRLRPPGAQPGPRVSPAPSAIPYQTDPELAPQDGGQERHQGVLLVPPPRDALRLARRHAPRDDPGGDPVRDRGVRELLSPGAGGGLRRARDPRPPRLPRAPVPVTPLQQADRRLRRLAREPHALPARMLRLRPARGR